MKITRRDFLKGTAAGAASMAMAGVLGMPVMASESDGSTPRNETLYFSGQQWGTIASWNPMDPNANNAMGIMQGDSSRTLLYETLFMYNMLDGQLYGLLATDYEWADDNMSALIVHLNQDAHWSDGTAVTAADVVATFNYHVNCESSIGLDIINYVSSMEATDDYTVQMNSVMNDDGIAANYMMILRYTQQMYIMQEAYLQTVEARCETLADMKTDTMEDFVGSGPYLKYFDDDQKVVFIRDDNYWGQAESMWGCLPAPTYIAHTIYADNAGGDTALRAGEVDVSQQFTTNVQDLWEVDGLPITTYIDEEPYNMAATMPSLWFNTEVEGLDQVAVRKAIAMAIDYEQIRSSAMSNQSPSFDDVPRSTMNPTDGEQALIDADTIASLQWASNDIDGAIAVLDEAGIVDSDGDGVREYNGSPLSFTVECPTGWTDWQASLEIVAQCANEIGIQVETYYPDASVFYDDLYSGNFQLIMNSPSGSSIVCPWIRCMQFLSSTYADLEYNTSGNWGKYRNDEADEILDAIAVTTDNDQLIEYYTRLNEIYLTDVPSVALMYRPQLFYTVNESVWTGYPMYEDGSNIPPTDCTDGYGIAALYNLVLVEELE
ncbi:MAG: ABC transporter substrate-binding protein [Lachnospiraceae bacterium]|nr:ABC transporter substrate-binding protein [Lachnospiraceae bacterium]